MFAAAALIAAAGCSSTRSGRMPLDFDKLVEDSESHALDGQAPGAPLDIRSAIEIALKNNPQIAVLREAAGVARARARTCPDLRDPELRVSYGESEETVDRSWLVPRSEIVPGISYPYDKNLLITSHPEDVDKTTEPYVSRKLLPPGGETNYITKSTNTFHGQSSESENYTVAVRFFPPNPFLMSAHSAAARAEYAASLSDLYSTEWWVRTEVKRLFSEMDFLQTDLGLVDQLVSVRRAASELFDDLSARQEIPAIDAMAASQRYAQTLALRDEIQKKMLTARSELGALLGQSSVVIETGTLSRIVDTNFLREVGSRFELKKTALQNRQDIAAAYWRTQVAQALIREGRALEIPWFSHIQGSYGWSRQSENPDIAWNLAGGTAQLDPFYQVSIDDTESTEWRVEAAITIPLFSIGRATRIPAAEYKRTLSALGASTKIAIAQVDGALSYLQGTEERSSLLESDFAARAESARRLLGDMEQRADLPPGDLEKVREVAIEMDRELLKDRHEQILGLVRLEQALGMTLDEAAAATTPAPAVAPKTP